MKRPLNDRLVLLLPLFILLMMLGALAFTSRRKWLWMPSNPLYSMGELGGLTPAQVKEKLGPPQFEDLQRDENPPPIIWMYSKGFARCVLTFKDGRVREVRVFVK
jgi:hypothetical protein